MFSCALSPYNAVTFLCLQMAFKQNYFCPLSLLDDFYFQRLNINVKMVYRNKLALIFNRKIGINDS